MHVGIPITESVVDGGGDDDDDDVLLLLPLSNAAANV